MKIFSWFIGLFILLFVIGISFEGIRNTNRDTITAQVVKTERVCASQEICKYLVFTDKGVFENTDSLLNFKWNSSDIYGELKAGETYTFNVYGWRVPFLSMYKNIVSVEK